MSQKVVYQFDPATGFIGATNASDWADNHPYLAQPNQVVVSGYIPATFTSTQADGTKQSQPAQVVAGWSFVLDSDGNPTLDAQGNYVVNPPPFPVPPPDIHMHNFNGLVNAGFIDISKVDPTTINAVNRSFATVGLAPVKGTALVPAPDHSAVTASAAVALPSLKAAPAKG